MATPTRFRGQLLQALVAEGYSPTDPEIASGWVFFYWNFSDELQSTVNPIIDFGNGSGLEAYYSYAITPWFHLTGDVQYINPANQDFSDALFLGLRAGLRF